jgi:hypothetical protein
MAKTVTVAGAEAKAKATVEAKDAGEAEATMLDVDRVISENLATDPLGEDFDLRHLGGQELFEEEKLELKEFVVSCGYQPGSLLFSGVDEEILGCIRDRAGAKIVGTLSKSVGFPKLETDISCYRRQHIVGSLFYSSSKVRPLIRLLLLLSSW